MHSSFLQLARSVYEYEDELLHDQVDVAGGVVNTTANV